MPYSISSFFLILFTVSFYQYGLLFGINIYFCGECNSERVNNYAFESIIW